MPKHILALGLALGLACCALPPNVVVLIPDEGGTTGRIQVSKNDRREDLSVPYAALGTGGGGRDAKVFVTDRATVEANFRSTLTATPRSVEVFTILFVIGQTDIDPASADALTEAIKDALNTPHADISVIGHSDATGDDAQNLALSLRRATEIRDKLVTAGVNPAVIEINYHGSNNPAVNTRRGVPEPRNRRVEVTIR